VEILHGGNSAAYGSDAVGGVINILTYPQSSPARLTSNHRLVHSATNGTTFRGGYL
jgi:outer membrane cobalamin receptor